jgi:hypothetical protein
MSTNIPPALRDLVLARAQMQCEYCLLPADVAFMLPHEIDHIIARKHGGETVERNLALTCWRCNRHKGTDLASLDPVTSTLTPLFNPHTQLWELHFVLDSARIVGRFPASRTTAQLLRFNTPERIAERQRLIDTGQLIVPRIPTE